MAAAATKKKRTASWYMTRIEAAENYRDRTYRDKWTRYYKIYRNMVDQLRDEKGKPITDRSNISIPMAFTMLETILPRLVETLFAARPYIRMRGVPTSVMDFRLNKMVKPWEIAAKKMETLIDYQMNVPMDIRDLFTDGLKICGLYGTTVAYTGWKYTERTRIRREQQPVMSDEMDPETGAPVPLMDDDGMTPVTDWVQIEETVPEYDDPEVKFLDLGLFFVDPNASDIDDARFAGHVCYLSKADIDGMTENDDDMKVDWKKVPKLSASNEARNYRMTAIGMPSVDDANIDQSADDDLYEVHFYWEDDRSVVIINRAYLAKDAENPFWHRKKPYDRAVYCTDPGNFYGIGIIEMVYDLQMELNAERNQRIDYRSYSMRRMFKVRRGANIPKQQLRWKQGGYVELDKMDDLDVLPAPDNNLGGSFNEEQTIKKDAQDATGAQDVVMGSSRASETATTTMSKDNNASTRFKMVISALEKTLLVAITRKMVQLDQQYVDDIRLLPLFDKDESEWPEISPEEIQGEFYLTPAGSSVEPIANKEAYKQRMVELYGIASKDPFYQQFPDKRRNLLEKVFESFDIQDTEDLLPSDAQVAGVMEQQTIQRFIQSLPPNVAQVLSAFMPPPGQPAPPGGVPPDAAAPPGASGANTAAMQEQGMQMQGAGV
ncbi:hypothetical protein GXP70_12410 [Paenibacillus lycopersici]|uniref:Uncharacterized protein n=1 Tax=Paenibacillus lycopersici TaxID=2704462 RepID=A0A6C0FYU0_9BACL|nr:hypothetical protein [Paenibacillus lycopersici]QHT60663.1 hypothetical protein GXP70_12410 [Paenibacillus lycopersici]